MSLASWKIFVASWAGKIQRLLGFLLVRQDLCDLAPQNRLDLRKGREQRPGVGVRRIFQRRFEGQLIQPRRVVFDLRQGCGHGAGQQKPSQIGRTKREAPPRLPRGAGRGYGRPHWQCQDAETGVTGTATPQTRSCATTST